MIKKLITTIVAVVMLVTLLPTQVFAANDPYAYDTLLAHNKKLFAAQRTDAYALDYFSLSEAYYQRQQEVTGYKSAMEAKVKEITKGITDEYAKAKAIADWLSLNMVYTQKTDNPHLSHLPVWQYGSCEAFASTTTAFYQLAGFPARTVSGYAYGVIYDVGTVWDAHAWNHVYINGRWVYVDNTWGEFDVPVEDWSHDHKLGRLNETDWNGTLEVYDVSTREKLMTVGPVALGTQVNKIPELAGMKLSVDVEGNYPIIDADKFSSEYRKLYARTHKVSFEVQLDNAYKSLVPHYVREDAYGDLYSYISVPSGAKLPQVKLPEKAGYTFIGWKDQNTANAPIWNEYTDKVTKDMAFVAVFQKGTVNYTVNFNTNGGSTVKAATVKANTKVAKPANPTKAGYNFTGWYLDSAGTEPWDFNTNIVRRNTTLYAGWSKVITANPTTSKVLVNGKTVTFEAYVIDGNNYFKLRDFAQAVNKTAKNFEVTWDGKNNAINLISNKAYTSAGGELTKGDGKAKVATPTTSKIYKDGKEISLTAYTIGGNNYFKLRDMAKAFNIGVFWDGATNTVIIDTTKDYVD